MGIRLILPLEKEELWPEEFAKEQPVYQFLIRVLISCVLLGVAIYVLVIDQSASNETQKWACGIVGTILGYWFKR
jgi:hypothetical protein